MNRHITVFGNGYADFVSITNRGKTFTYDLRDVSRSSKMRLIALHPMGIVTDDFQNDAGYSLTRSYSNSVTTSST